MSTRERGVVGYKVSTGVYVWLWALFWKVCGTYDLCVKSFDTWLTVYPFGRGLVLEVGGWLRGVVLYVLFVLVVVVVGRVCTEADALEGMVKGLSRCRCEDLDGGVGAVRLQRWWRRQRGGF